MLFFQKNISFFFTFVCLLTGIKTDFLQLKCSLNQIKLLKTKLNKWKKTKYKIQYDMLLIFVLIRTSFNTGVYLEEAKIFWHVSPESYFNQNVGRYLQILFLNDNLGCQKHIPTVFQIEKNVLYPENGQKLIWNEKIGLYMKKKHI